MLPKQCDQNLMKQKIAATRHGRIASSCLSGNIQQRLKVQALLGFGGQGSGFLGSGSKMQGAVALKTLGGWC